jgi:predicted RNA-binding Zn-ribbon protein involved in translation (DUF1610 family)
MIKMQYGMNISIICSLLCGYKMMSNNNKRESVGLIQECPECGTKLTKLICEREAHTIDTVELEDIGTPDMWACDGRDISYENSYLWQCPECGAVLIDTEGEPNDIAVEVVGEYLKTTDLILHELGHEFGNHTESRYHESLTRMAQSLVILALKEPEFFEVIKK